MIAIQQRHRRAHWANVETTNDRLMTTMLQSALTMFVHHIHPLRVIRMNLEMQQQLREYARRTWNLLQNQVLKSLLQKASAVSHVPQARGDQDLLASWKIWRKLLEHATLWHRAHDLVLQLTICE